METYLKQVVELIERIDNYSVIGAHCRHVIESYKSLIDGIIKGAVSYESKNRDLRLQEDPNYAIHVAANIVEEIQFLNKCSLVLAAGFPSTVGRELEYCFDHEIHHAAIIRHILRENKLEHLVNDNFGLSKSTIEFRKNG